MAGPRIGDPIGGGLLFNPRRAPVRVGSIAIEAAPWSPRGQLASNAGSLISSLPMWRGICG